MKKCHNFCKNDYLPELYKNVPANLKSIMNKTKIAGIDRKKLEDMDYGLCKKNFCNESCGEGFEFDLLFGKVKEAQKKKFQENFIKKLYNGFVDSYSAEEVEMFKKKVRCLGALSQLIMMFELRMRLGMMFFINNNFIL